MKRSTAVRHLLEMADDCVAVNQTLEGLDSEDRVVSLWAYGPIVGSAAEWVEDELEYVRAAVALRAPDLDLHWYARPPGIEWIESLQRWDKRPIHVMWRSADAPIWNHSIDRPVLLWDESTGHRPHAAEAISAGEGVDHHREPAPTRTQLREQLNRDADLCHRAMVRTAAAYDDHRWDRGPLRRYAEPLWEATAGHLDLQDALRALDDGA